MIKLTGKIICNSEKAERISSKIRNKTRMPTLTTLTQLCTESPNSSNQARGKKKKKKEILIECIQQTHRTILSSKNGKKQTIPAHIIFKLQKIEDEINPEKKK